MSIFDRKVIFKLVESESDIAERLPPRRGQQREEIHAVPHPARGQDHSRPQDVERRRRRPPRRRDPNRLHAVQRRTAKYEVGRGGGDELIQGQSSFPTKTAIKGQWKCANDGTRDSDQK